MKRWSGCGWRVLRGAAGLAAIAAIAACAAVAPFACHAYDEAAYDEETSGAADASVDATTRDALADGDTGGQNDAAGDAAGDAMAPDAQADASSDGGSPEGSCAPIPGALPSEVIPALDGTQTVDGLNTEFCGVPYVTFDPSKGYVSTGTPPFPSPAPQLTLQVAWTRTALAVFAHVAETPVKPQVDGGAIYDGDAIEIFVAASSAALKGVPDGDPGTFHFILAPASASGHPATGESYGTNDSAASPVPLQSSTFASVLVADGYDIEVTFPWALFGGTAPTSGSLIGFDFGVDVSQSDSPDAGTGTKVLQGFYYVRPGTLAPPTACSRPEPFCDDRTWSTPQLE